MRLEEEAKVRKGGKKGVKEVGEGRPDDVTSPYLMREEGESG